MKDIDREVETLLRGSGIRAVYSSPAEKTELPAVSYYMLSERCGFSCDNEEAVTEVRVQADIWARSGAECHATYEAAASSMAAGGFVREFAMDVPKDADGVYHRTVRFAKSVV